jgi:hypothetical protein
MSPGTVVSNQLNLNEHGDKEDGFLSNRMEPIVHDEADKSDNMISDSFASAYKDIGPITHPPELQPVQQSHILSAESPKLKNSDSHKNDDNQKIAYIE